MELSVRYMGITQEQRQIIEDYAVENGGTILSMTKGIMFKKEGDYEQLRSALRAFSGIRYDWVELE